MADNEAKKAAAAVETTQKEVQSNFDAASEKGHFGERVDPTPLENYSVTGVIQGKPTPETDAKASAEAAAATSTPPNVVS